MIPKRIGLIVWVNDLRLVKNMERYGNVHYISKRYNYVILYVNESEAQKTKNSLEKLRFVKKVEHSYRGEMNSAFTKVSTV